MISNSRSGLPFGLLVFDDLSHRDMIPGDFFSNFGVDIAQAALKAGCMESSYSSVVVLVQTDLKKQESLDMMLG